MRASAEGDGDEADHDEEARVGVPVAQGEVERVVFVEQAADVSGGPDPDQDHEHHDGAGDEKRGDGEAHALT